MPKSWAQTLQTIKECKNQIFTSLIVTIGSFGTGTVFGWSSVAITTLFPHHPKVGEFHESKKNHIEQMTIVSWVTSLAILGAFIGGPIGGALMDYIGRRYSILAFSFPMFLGWLTIVSAYFTKPNGFVLFYIGRTLTGICAGSYLVIIPSYLKEISDDDLRGVLGSMMPLSLVCGILFSFLLGAYTNWFVLSCGCAISPVALAVGVFFIPETPRYLIVKNKIDKAILSFKKLSGTASDEEALAKLTAIFPDDFNKDPNKKPPKKGFLRRCVLCPIGIMVLVMMFQQLSGVNAITLYTVEIFIQASGGLDPELATVMLGVVNVIFVLVSVFIIELLGRKTLLTWMHLLMALCLSILAAFFYLVEKNDGSHKNITWLAPTVIYLYMAAYCCGPGSIPWVLGSEIYNPGYRAESATIMTTSYWIFGFLVAKTFEDLSIGIHRSGCFWFYAACSFGGFIFSLLFVPETKGKSSDEIMEHFGAMLTEETEEVKADGTQIDGGGDSLTAPPSLSLNPSDAVVASGESVLPVTSDIKTKDAENPG